MYCRKCGALINPQEKFCGSCGAIIEQNESAEDNSALIAQKSKKKHRLVGIIACAIVAVLIFVGVFAILNRSEEPKVVVEKYLNALVAFDYDTLSKYSAFDLEAALRLAFTYSSASEDEIKDMLLDEYGMTDIKKIFQGPLKEEAYEKLKDQYGADYIVSVNVVETTELSDLEMSNQLDTYRDVFDNEDSGLNGIIDLDKISAMCQVRGKLSIEGSEGEDSDAFELYCAKIGGKWKVFSSPDI